MGLSTSYLSKAEVQELLGVNSFGMWWLTRQHEGFPAPVERFDLGPSNKAPDGPVWDGTEMYWLAAGESEYQNRGAILLRPLSENLEPGGWLAYQDTP
jgi:hypothetical protein